MRRWESGLWLMVLSCWTPMTLAEPAKETPAEPAKAEKTSFSPAEDYDTGIRTYENGDLIGAMSLFKRAADAGHAGAQERLAYILDKSEFNEEAVKYYRMSAKQGNADGQTGLGLMLAAGEGVKQDFVEARKWIFLAAEQRHKQAINVIAEAYIRGGLGFDEDARQDPGVLDWIRRSADNDHLPAIDALAAAYGTGQYGLAVDQKQAADLVARANRLRGIDPDKDQNRKKKKSRKNAP